MDLRSGPSTLGGEVLKLDLIVEGTGPRSIVMIHGWPDTYRLWDGQVAALKERYCCVRFTLPGFEPAQRGRAYSLIELLESIRRAVEEASPAGKVTLLLHDWGCVLGYQFAMRYPQLVERVVGVDIGDAGSRNHRVELGASGKLKVMAYQVWLALAWRIGGSVGNAMARWMARVARCPTDPRTIGSQMGYLYALRWLRVAGGLEGVRLFAPRTPMLFIYGERKQFMFHSRAWAAQLAARRSCRVIGLPTGHWVMIDEPRGFNDALLSWLGETDAG